jgi:hypothetical protein
MARCTDPGHLKHATHLALRHFDGSFLSVLLESDSNGLQSPNLKYYEIIDLMNKYPPDLLEEFLLTALTQPQHYKYLLPAAVNKGFVKYAKKMHHSHMELYPNRNLLDSNALHNIEYLDPNCLHRLFKEVGVPVPNDLMEVLAGYPSIKRPTSLDRALVRFCRLHERGKVVISADSSAKALSVFNYVLENFENVSIPPSALPLAILSRNRQLMDILLDKEGFSVTSDALHTAFFIRDYPLLQYLLDKLTTNTMMCSPSSASPLKLPVINEKLSQRMPHPVTPSDGVFFEMLEKLVLLGVYDHEKWKNQVIYDALRSRYSVTPGVARDLIRYGKAQVTAKAISRSEKLTNDEEFKFMFEQPIAKQEIEKMKYRRIRTLERATILRSVGVPVTLRCINMLGPRSAYFSRNSEIRKLYEYFTQVLTWYIEDKMNLSSSQTSNVFDDDDMDELYLISDLLRHYELFSLSISGARTVPPHQLFEQLVNLGFPIRQGDVTKAEEQGWTLLVEIFRDKLVYES